MFGKTQPLALPLALAAALTASSICSAQVSIPASSTPYAGGWPTANATDIGDAGDCGAGQSTFKQNWEKWKADFHLVTNRNSAWPLPFTCQDREAYHQLWAVFQSQGVQIAHTLTQEYFDPVTNELNRAGRSKVSWIMQTAPATDKSFFVYQDSVDQDVNARIANVRNTVQQWYSHMGPVTVASTNVLPHQIPAYYQARIIQKYFDGQPVPVINVDTGSSISGSVGQ